MKIQLIQWNINLFALFTHAATFFEKKKKQFPVGSRVDKACFIFKILFLEIETNLHCGLDLLATLHQFIIFFTI